MPEADLLVYVRVLNRWKQLILGATGTVAVLSVIVSFLLPKWYAARSTLIPPQESDIQSSLLSLVQGISLPGVGGISAVSGESQLFIAILDSRTLREKMIRDFDLMRVYKTRTMDDALRTNTQLARPAVTDRGVVEVVVEDRDPKRAAEMANAWVRSLDEFNKTARMTAGKKSRIFVEGRLEETRGTLRSTEEALAAYQLAHKSAPLTSDATAAVQAGATLIARRIALQVRLNMLSDLYRDTAPQVEQIRGELAALDRQIDTMPPLAVDYARLLRDLKVQEQVYVLLTAQYEEAKIRENKDIPTVEILDQAVPPQRRVRPIRWLFCTSLTLAALVLSLGTAFGVEFVRRIRAAAPDPATAGTRDAGRPG